MAFWGVEKIGLSSRRLTIGSAVCWFNGELAGVQCSKCKSEMKEEKVQVPDERALLPTMVERTQFTCVNPKCESFNRPVILKPLPGPRFQRGTKFLSDLEQWRLEQLRKVAMASGLESTSLKVVDAIGTRAYIDSYDQVDRQIGSIG